MKTASSWQLGLMGRWGLRGDGVEVEVTLRQQRMLAALAILGSLPRRSLSAALWPSSREVQAAGSLRAGLWQISHELPGLVVAGRDRICLDPAVGVDWHLVQARMAAIRDDHSGIPDLGDVDDLRRARLLPGWYEDFVLLEQERFDQLRLDCLERMARRFFALGRAEDGVEAAWAAASIDPLRESAHRLMIEGHILDGNHGLAVRAYHDYRLRLGDELGILPSPRMNRLVADLLARPVTLQSRSSNEAAHIV